MSTDDTTIPATVRSVLRRGTQRSPGMWGGHPLPSSTRRHESRRGEGLTAHLFAGGADTKAESRSLHSRNRVGKSSGQALGAEEPSNTGGWSPDLRAPSIVTIVSWTWIRQVHALVRHFFPSENLFIGLHLFIVHCFRTLRTDPGLQEYMLGMQTATASNDTVTLLFHFPTSVNSIGSGKAPSNSNDFTTATCGCSVFLSSSPLR